MFQHGASAVKEAVVNESSSDSARVVVTLSDRGKSSGADEVRQNQNAHIEHMYAITFGAGETDVGGFASWSYVSEKRSCCGDCRSIEAERD